MRAGRVGLPIARRAAARAFIDDHLADPGLSATDVAARCGFTSMSHFSQAFRRRFGMTAGQTRVNSRDRDRPTRW